MCCFELILDKVLRIPGWSQTRYTAKDELEV